MKKFLLVLLVVLTVLSLSGCMILSGLKKNSKPLEAGSVLPDDRIAIIGKLSTDPGLNQELTFTMKSLNGRSNIMFGLTQGENSQDFTESDVTAISNIERDQYFLISLPREKSYLCTISTEFSESRTLYLYPNLEFDPESEDKFVYIGDITIRFDQENELGGKDTMVEVSDNFDQIKDHYKGFIIDSSGSPLAVDKNLLGITSEIVEMEMIQTIVTYY